MSSAVPSSCVVFARTEHLQPLKLNNCVSVRLCDSVQLDNSEFAKQQNAFSLAIASVSL